MSDNENKETPETLLSFPCDFPIKVFGIKSDQFEIDVLTIIRSIIPNLAENSISCRPSKDDKYLALTIIVPVTSKAQLDDVYRALTKSPLVIMTL